MGKQRSKKDHEQHIVEYDVSSMDQELFADPILLLEYFQKLDGQESDREKLLVDNSDKLLGEKPFRPSSYMIEKEIVSVLNMSSVPIDKFTLKKRSKLLSEVDIGFLEYVLFNLRKSRVIIEFVSNRGQSTLYSINQRKAQKYLSP